MVISLERKLIKDPKTFFWELGGCHDCCITEFSWNENESEEGDGLCIFKIDDLNMAFSPCSSKPNPNYQERPAEIVFTGVSFLEIGVTLINNENPFIYGMDIICEGEDYRVKINCSPGGLFDIKCKKIFLIENS
jgi:hypothetical protein